MIATLTELKAQVLSITLRDKEKYEIISEVVNKIEEMQKQLQNKVFDIPSMYYIGKLKNVNSTVEADGFKKGIHSIL